MRTNTICFINQKGGCGKSSSCFHLAGHFAIIGLRVLVIDADPQGNTTSGLVVQKAEGMTTLYDVLVNGRELHDAICKTEMEGLDLVPADKNLIGVNVELVGSRDREALLRHKLAGI